MSRRRRWGGDEGSIGGIALSVRLLCASILAARNLNDYTNKQVEAYAVEEQGWLVITVMVKFF